VPEPLSTQQLLDLYRIAVDEYRFQVKLNWDRTAYLITLNSGLIAVATGLLKVGSAAVLDIFVAGVFLVGAVVSAVSIKNILTGHRYYRRTILKKTVIEDQLGLTKPLEQYSGRPTLAISTTVGQDEALQILHDTEKWLKRGHRLTSITSWTVWILILFILFDAGGFCGSVWLYRHPPSQNQPASKTGP
jgi:hypothetical protein